MLEGPDQMCVRILTRCSYIVSFKLEISERAGRVDSRDVDRVLSGTLYKVLCFACGFLFTLKYNYILCDLSAGSRCPPDRAPF